MFCCMLLYIPSSFAIILMEKRELVALLSLSSWCLVIVVWLFLAVPCVCLQFVIVVFPDHTHYFNCTQLPDRTNVTVFNGFNVDFTSRSSDIIMLGRLKRPESPDINNNIIWMTRKHLSDVASKCHRRRHYTAPSPKVTNFGLEKRSSRRLCGTGA